jgi:hypothetical protein
LFGDQRRVPVDVVGRFLEGCLGSRPVGARGGKNGFKRLAIDSL